MARIVVSAHSNVTWLPGRHVDSFVEGMIRALVRAGNDVLNFRVNDFYFNGQFLASRKAVRRKLDEFKPDLIITLNNELPYPEFVKDTNCPIACMAADSYAFFANKSTIKEYPDRYYFLNFSNDTAATLNDWFPQARPNRNILFGHATDLRAVDIAQDIDVSFVGSLGNWNRDFVDYFQRLPHLPRLTYSEQNDLKETFYELVDKFRVNPFEELSSSDLPHYRGSQPLEASLIHLLTCQKRFAVLTNLADLGLRLYGYPHAFSELVLYDSKLFRCFDFTPSVTLADATRTYNRSRISLNLPHAHAKEGFSWRVCDILASNAVLVSCPQPDLVNLSKGYMKLPMFANPLEAHDISQRLLKDEVWRNDLVQASQLLIDEKCRFESRFLMMQDAIPGLTLFSPKEGTIEWVDGTLLLRKFAYRKEILYRHLRNYLINALS